MNHDKSIRRDLERKIKKNKCSYYTLYCEKKIPLKEIRKKDLTR